MKCVGSFACAATVNVVVCAAGVPVERIIGRGHTHTSITMVDVVASGAPYRDQLKWDRIHFFWADERCVPPGHADSNYRIAAADLSKVTYVGGASVGSEALSVAVSADGNTWSAASATVTTIGATVSARNGSVQTGNTLSLSSLFSASEPDATAILQYRVVDPTGLGAIQLNGATNLLGAAGAYGGIVRSDRTARSDEGFRRYLAEHGPAGRAAA